MAWWVLKVSQGCSQGISWAVFLSIAQIPLPRSKGYWQNPVPCSCRTDVCFPAGCQLEATLSI